MNVRLTDSIALRGAVCLFLAALLLSAVPAGAEDWPTFAHDYRRSRVTSESLATSALAQAWVYTPNSPPQPGWPHPMRRDTYNFGDRAVKPRVVFDRVSQVAAAGDAVYFGSSSDDSVCCLDATTGRERWSFTTEGPIRLCPSWAGGKLYFGSDDGRAYCLRATDGAPVWKYRASEEDYRVPNDGKLVSLWPVRTGVVVDGGAAYFCAGLFPSETVYICAVDAGDGEPIWTQTRNDLSPQGHLLASATRIYVPGGRSTPIAFSRADGRSLGKFGGGGGTYTLVTDDGTLIYGPGRTSGELASFGAESRDHFATFQGNHILVTPDMSYLHTDSQLAALDRKRYTDLIQERTRVTGQLRKLKGRLGKVVKSGDRSKIQDLKAEIQRAEARLTEIGTLMEQCMPWTRDCKHPHSLILAGDTLFAGGDNEVAAYTTKDGANIWSSAVDGKVYGLAAANGRLFVSTDTGRIYCFSAMNSARKTKAGETGQ